LIPKFFKLGTRGSLIKEPTITGYNHCGGRFFELFNNCKFWVFWNKKIAGSGYFKPLKELSSFHERTGSFLGGYLTFSNI
jgi:hypothetical protein